jgi:hypothetical protein
VAWQRWWLTKVYGGAFLELHGVIRRDFIGQTPDVVHKDSMVVSISNSSLEAMIPLGFVKGENFPIRCFTPVSRWKTSSARWVWAMGSV